MPKSLVEAPQVNLEPCDFELAPFLRARYSLGSGGGHGAAGSWQEPIPNGVSLGTPCSIFCDRQGLKRIPNICL